MKKLNQFTYFDFEAFAEGKRFLCTGQQPWKDFDTKEILGTKIEVVIVQDQTDYELEEGDTTSNLYEKLTIKVPKIMSIPGNVEVQLLNVEAMVYGEYRNQLSCVAEDVLIVNK